MQITYITNEDGKTCIICFSYISNKRCLTFTIGHFFINNKLNRSTIKKESTKDCNIDEGTGEFKGFHL